VSKRRRKRLEFFAQNFEAAGEYDGGHHLKEATRHARSKKFNKRERDPREALDFMIGAAVELCGCSARTDMGRNHIMHYLIILGENTRHIHPEERQVNAHIPWKNLMDNRNFLAHNPQNTDAVYWQQMEEFIKTELPLKILPDLIDLREKRELFTKNICRPYILCAA